MLDRAILSTGLYITELDLAMLDRAWRKAQSAKCRPGAKRKVQTWRKAQSAKRKAQSAKRRPGLAQSADLPIRTTVLSEPVLDQRIYSVLISFS
jgi:hypothetical protein